MTTNDNPIYDAADDDDFPVHDTDELVGLLLDDVMLMGDDERIRIIPAEQAVMELLSTEQVAPEVSTADLTEALAELSPESYYDPSEALADADAHELYRQVLWELTEQERDLWLNEAMLPSEDLGVRSMWLLARTASHEAREMMVRLLVALRASLACGDRLYDDVAVARRQGRSEAERVIARAIERSQGR